MSKPNTIDLRRHFRTFYQYIWLFIFIFLFFSALAITFICISQPRYDSEALLLIEESSEEMPQKSGLLSLMRNFSISGGFGRASMDNEILLVSSRDVVNRTVKALNLNVEVSEKNGLTKKLLFNNSPFDIELSDGFAEQLKKGLFISAEVNNGKWDFSVREGRLFGKKIAEKKNMALPSVIDTPYGKITFNINSTNPVDKNNKFLITIENPEITAHKLYKNVKIEPRDKVSDVILLTITDIGRERGAAILNEMMGQYNSKRLERRKENSLTELNFLDDRINTIYAELTESEKKVENFKLEKQFTDIKAEAPILLESTLDSHKDLIITSAEMAYYEQVLNLLNSGTEGMLPSIAIPGEKEGKEGPNKLITLYNEEYNYLKDLEKNALPGNTALEKAKQRLDNMKESIIKSFSQLLAGSKLIYSKQSGATNQMTERLKNMPSYEREYINLYRDNLLKNELYGYLMEKRENAMLQYYSLSTLGFVIDEAYTGIKPSIKRPAIFISGLVIFALIVILTLIIILTKRRQTVDDMMDLADFGLETNSIKTNIKDLNDNISKVRAWLTSDKSPKVIFIAEFDSEKSILNSISESFQKAEIPYEIISITGNANDKLISPQISLKIRDILSVDKYIFVPVPDAYRIEDISTEINAAESRIILAVPTGYIDRKTLYKRTQPILDEKIFTILLKG